MSQSFENNIDEIIDVVLNEEERERIALQILLDKLGKRKSHLTAVSAKMGTTNSYLTTVPLKWIASNVLYAKDLPVFKEHITEADGRIEINKVTLDFIQQREPDSRRQLPMALYLATRKYHKFGPLIIVAYQDWVYNKLADEWGYDGKAGSDSLNVTPIDSSMFLVDLDLEQTKYFALDGQHRLMAIKGLASLIDGRLEAKRKDGTSIPKKALTSDDIENFYLENETLGLNVNDFQNLLNDTMGIEIIPAVQGGETRDEAISRLRNIFVDINENAKKLEKGELILLSENDGYQIVARTIITLNDLLINRVSIERKSLTEASNEYTTLKNVFEICKNYLGKQAEFEKWEQPILNLKELGFLRPEDEEIEAAIKRMDEYFKALKKIPSHNDMVQGTEVQELRSRKGRDNILFWPFAQLALAEAIADLQSKKQSSLDVIVRKIKSSEEKGQLKMTDLKAPWFGIVCDANNKLRTTIKQRELCKCMFTYLLGDGLPDEGREKLRRRFFNARKITRIGDIDEQAYDLSGNLSSFNENFHLPDPWH